MARAVILSNGELCVSLDERGEVRDIYYPHVGLEDHVRGHYVHRLGAWVDGQISWFSDPDWHIEVSSEADALASSIVATHKRLQLEIRFKDIVYNERAVFLRRVSVTNKADRVREIKLYFAHQFEIYKSHGSDTAYYDPHTSSLIHYKGHRVFLIGAQLDGRSFQDYATGRANFQGKQGSHIDAEDGALSKNPIEHGPADSVLGVYGTYAAGQSRTCYYWIAAAKSIPDAQDLNAYVIEKSPEHMIKTASNFWHAWVNAYKWDFEGLAPEHVTLFKRSLLYMRAAVDKDGGILASVDSDMLQYGLDTYSYVWPRDAAYVAMSLDMAGDNNTAQRFFSFSKDVLFPEGYFLHKYLPDKSLGSSWHPWIKDGVPQLPIQEDETALVIYALKKHYDTSKDLDFLEEIYGTLVEKAADFMVTYRDSVTKLPLPSYDLWERKRGISTFTCSAVYAALIAAAELSRILGKDSHAERYELAAREIQNSIIQHLWDEKEGVFINMLVPDSGITERDTTVDVSSAYGVFSFGVLPLSDPRLHKAWEKTVRVLSRGITSGGLARFENDDYYQIDKSSAGNPWVITTLWYADYLTAKAKNDHDFDRVRDIFSWVVRHAQPSGVLSEQLDPHTGNQVGATPLTWAHSSYVSSVLQYLEKRRELGL